MPDRLTPKEWKELEPYILCETAYCDKCPHTCKDCPSVSIIKKLAQYEDADAEKRIYTAHDVAEVLAEFFGDPCACNFNGIDEWLPALCDFDEKSCPNPGGVACWEQYLKHKGKADEK